MLAGGTVSGHHRRGEGIIAAVCCAENRLGPGGRALASAHGVRCSWGAFSPSHVPLLSLSPSLTLTVAFFGYLLNVVTSLLTASGPAAKRVEAIRNKLEVHRPGWCVRLVCSCACGVHRGRSAGWLRAQLCCEPALRVQSLQPRLGASLGI